MPTSRALRSSVLSLTLIALPLSSSAAQNPAPSISPELAHRIESMLRSRVDLPPASSITFGERSPGEVPGYDRIQAHYSRRLTAEKGAIALLISKDGTHVAQFNTFDISADPGLKLSADDRPSRGGPAGAPVTIV